MLLCCDDPTTPHWQFLPKVISQHPAAFLPPTTGRCAKVTPTHIGACAEACHEGRKHVLAVNHWCQGHLCTFNDCLSRVSASGNLRTLGSSLAWHSSWYLALGCSLSQSIIKGPRGSDNRDTGWLTCNRTAQFSLSGSYPDLE